MVKHVEIINKEGKTLRGYMHMPSLATEIVVMFHGFTGNKTEHAHHFRNFSRILEQNNIASLRLDFSGNGESDGEFKDFTFDTMMDEAKIIIEFAKKQPNIKNVDLLGFSMGGAVAAMIARDDITISKLLLWSAAGNIMELIRDKYNANEKDENGNIIFSNYFEMSKMMYESTFNYYPYQRLDKYTNPVLVINGTKDLSVPYLNAVHYAVSFPNSTLKLIDSAGHGYDSIANRDELYSATLKFIVGNY